MDLQASGNMGKLTIPAFRESGLDVTAVVQSSSQAIFPSEIAVVKTDFDLASLTRAFQGKDAVISMIPIVSLGEQAVVIEAAIAAGVKRFVPSEFGSDSTAGTQTSTLLSKWNANI
jgi:putative NADH-flavin reductase